jgi:hypothetical protein
LVIATVAAGLVSNPWSSEEQPGDHASDHEPEASADRSQAVSLEPANDTDEVEAYQPRHEHAWTSDGGETPTRAEASELEPHLEEFVVRGDEGLAEMDERGYLEGEGTRESPYVIDGFRIEDELVVRDTSKPLVVKNSYIEGQLKLNYAGEHLHVHHNFVRDLRVNENVDREGPTTSGLFAHNEIAFVGQLRHFSGTFAHNEIGPRPDGVTGTYLSDQGPADLPEDVVWNFDGYHGAHVHNNTVEGRTDVKLHGHFHGSCEACTPHAHHDEDDFPADEPEDAAPRSRHSLRYHVLDLENNTFAAGEADRALRVHDRAHAGDDQTAASEPNPYLEDRHEHHAYVRVAHNTVRGGTLGFDVVNADDERHEGLAQEALVGLEANEVHRERPRGEADLVSAFRVHAADTTRLQAEANAYEFQPEEATGPAGYGWVTDGELADAVGFRLHEVNASDVHVTGTEGRNATYGVLEEDVRENTPVVLSDNRFDAEEARHER